MSTARSARVLRVAGVLVPAVTLSAAYGAAVAAALVAWGVAPLTAAVLVTTLTGLVMVLWGTYVNAAYDVDDIL